MLLRALSCFAFTMAALAADVQILLKDGKLVEGPSKLASITVTVDGKARKLPLQQVLSVQSGEPASESESAKIASGITAIEGTDRKQRDSAVAELTAIGIPVISPLLKAYKDTDQHEPRPLYRLFERIIPSVGDGFNRELSLVRLANGEHLRGKVEGFATNGVSWANIRRLAVKRKSVTKHFDLHALSDCVAVEYLDSGLGLSTNSRLEVQSAGFVRLSWDTDGWATDANGLTKPGSPAYKSNLVNGHPFGAVIGRVGASGETFTVGKSYAKPSPAAGRLYLAVNDNNHWQNNIGSFRVTATATEAYDLGDPQ